MNVAAFRARYPEFDGANEARISSCLVEAQKELASAEWGDRFDTAHGLLTAHKLWNSPFGSTMRLDGDNKEIPSPYMRQYNELLNKTVSKFVVT